LRQRRWPEIDPAAVAWRRSYASVPWRRWPGALRSRLSRACRGPTRA